MELKDLLNCENVKVCKNNPQWVSLNTDKDYGYCGCGSYVAIVKHNKVWLLQHYTHDMFVSPSQALAKSKQGGFKEEELRDELKAVKLFDNPKTFLIFASCYDLCLDDDEACF